MFCPECKLSRNELHFRPKMSCCIFCELLAANAHTDVLLKFLNAAVPPDTAVQSTCSKCKEIVFWVNVVWKRNRPYCASCADDLKNGDLEAIGHFRVHVGDKELNALFE